MNRGVFLTFDVECSMGGAWRNTGLRPVPPARAMWGQYGSKQFGLPLIVEILEQYGLAATFFVEAFTDDQGFAGETERVCHYLLEHGQDVQLHIHPCHEQYGRVCRGQELVRPPNDQMAELPPAEQLALLQEGAQRMQRWTGHPVDAFRAGNGGASEETLRQVQAAGILIDSSYAFPFAGGQCCFSTDNPFNGSKWYSGVLELALSGFDGLRLPGRRAGKVLDLVGISFEECRDATERIVGAGADAVVILHSFSLLKKRDIQYNGGRPNGIVTRRFRRFCEWLAGCPERPVLTCSQLARAIREGTYEAAHVPPCRMPHPRSIVRKAAQVWNRFYWT